MLVKLKERQDLYLKDIAELPSLLEETCALLLDSYTCADGGLCMCLDKPGVHGISLFALFLNKKTDGNPANELMSIYERKDMESVIKKAWEKELRFFPNEKTETWLRRAGIRLPEEVTSLLKGSYAEVSKVSQIPATDLTGGKTDAREPGKSGEVTASIQPCLDNMLQSVQAHDAKDTSDVSGIDVLVYGNPSR